MQWPTIEEISAMTRLPEGHRFARMKRADIEPLIEAIREWFPSVSVGAASCYLTEQFYFDKVVMDDETDKDVIALLIKKGEELVGMGSWERESAAMTLYARLGAIEPAYRGARMAVLAMELGEKMGRAMGAGFIYTLATMKMPQMQPALERAGYQLIGFMPTSSFLRSNRCTRRASAGVWRACVEKPPAAGLRVTRSPRAVA